MYVKKFACPTKPLTDEKLMMLPPPLAFICGWMFCVTSAVLMMLTEGMSFHSAGVASKLRKINRAAQFTQT